MSQTLYLERGHIAGAVDFTKYVFEFGPIRMRKNEPTLFDFSVAELATKVQPFALRKAETARLNEH